ncbi:MAG: primosomal protein N', partial [Desulfovibrionaceae bacterium]|nr:primosomal protein N' [Desulfovibrionaceae bacterium]
MNIAVALLSPPYSTLTYAAPPEFPEGLWKPGLRLLVPLGAAGAIRAGMVLPAGGEAPEGLKLRPALWPLEREPLCPAVWIEMVYALAERQMLAPGKIIGSVLPAAFRSAGGRLRRERAGSRPELLSSGEVARLAQSARAELAADWLAGNADWLAPHADAAASEQCVLLQDPPWPVRPAAVRQMEVLEYLYGHGAVSRRALLRALGAGSRTALDALAGRGLIAIRTRDEEEEPEPGEGLLPPPPPLFSLSPAQTEAAARCEALLDAGKPAAELVYGVTGSGKTALYFELAKRCLQRGRSVFILAPEVALALKLRRDAREMLGGSAAVFFFHGYQSPGHKERVFGELSRRSAPCVVVGTRSALFLPLTNVGLIVLDEEHDASFKQDEGLVYHAKEVAWFLAWRQKALLVLGSATPDVKTFHAAQEGRIGLLSLPSRVGGGTLPDIRLVNIRDALPEEALLAPESLKVLQSTVEAGEQAVVLLNRRGYAPLMYCLDCGKAVRCPNCDIALTYHKGLERMVCHYCGCSVPFPLPCPSCRGMHFLPMGQGTEKAEEWLASLLPDGCGVLRLDRDSTRCPGKMEAILEAFAAREAQVLVGTQMLSKGHHFPDVTLVALLDVDGALFSADFRAAERFAQLYTQVSGRAGRAGKQG